MDENIRSRLIENVQSENYNSIEGEEEEKIKLKNKIMEKSFMNVLLLGFAFFLIFTSFQTGGMIQKTIVDGINEEYSKDWNGKKWDGYTSFFIIYGVFAIVNWIAPSIVAILGPKLSMFISALTYCLFVANFLYPLSFGLNIVSVIIGAGAAVIWTAQGNYLTINSNSNTMARNSGVFWAMLQGSLLFGNLFVYFEFQGKTSINDKTRVITYTVLTGTCLIGTFVLLLLGKQQSQQQQNGEERLGPLEALGRSYNLLRSRRMILLCVTFVYTGILLAFFSVVYGASIGYTLKLANDPKKFIGISGMLIGLGEIIGGAVFGLLGSRTTKHGRDPIILLGYLVHTAAFFLIFLNIPANASFSESTSSGIIEPSLALALLCSFLLGLGDSCYNTQLYSILGSAYKNDSASAFAIFKFFQSIAAAIAFVYTNYVNLHLQLLILGILNTFGALTFCAVEWNYSNEVKRNEKQKQSEMNANELQVNHGS